jgi:hypothetical protein
LRSRNRHFLKDFLAGGFAGFLPGPGFAVSAPAAGHVCSNAIATRKSSVSNGIQIKRQAAKPQRIPAAPLSPLTELEN